MTTPPLPDTPTTPVVPNLRMVSCPSMSSHFAPSPPVSPFVVLVLFAQSVFLFLSQPLLSFVFIQYLLCIFRLVQSNLFCSSLFFLYVLLWLSTVLSFAILSCPGPPV